MSAKAPLALWRRFGDKRMCNIVFAADVEHKLVFVSVQPWQALQGGRGWGTTWQGWVEAAVYSPLVACKLFPFPPPLPGSSVPCQACAQALK